MITSMTREEIAYRAGVGRETLRRYLKRHERELRKLGLRPRERLAPRVGSWRGERYGVDIEWSNG